MLVLEDDADTAALIKTLIEAELGIPVKAVWSGLAALDAVATAMPLAIIADLMVPELDGAEFMREVRQRYGTAVPLVVVSALARAKVQEAAGRAQARAVTKPFEVSDLLAAVADSVAPWLVAALEDRPKPGLADHVRRRLRSDPNGLVDLCWNVLRAANGTLADTRAMLRLLNQHREADRQRRYRGQRD